MTNVVPASIPLYDRIARPRDWLKYPSPKTQDPGEGIITKQWVEYLTNRDQITSTSPQSISSVSATAQTASIAATALPVGALATGTYRVTYYARVTTASGATSTLTVTLTWTDGGVSCSHAFPAMTGNNVGTPDSNTFLVESDANSPINYATTYGSTGAPAMVYKLTVILESVPR